MIKVTEIYHDNNGMQHTADIYSIDNCMLSGMVNNIGAVSMY